jgi:hypothetical protein
MQSSLTHVRLAGIAVTVGSVVRDFQAEGLAAGQEPAQLARLAKAVGLRERRIAAPDVTALDLSADAAARLLDEAAVDALVLPPQALFEAQHAFAHDREAEMSGADDAGVDRADGDFVYPVAFDADEGVFLVLRGEFGIGRIAA